MTSVADQADRDRIRDSLDETLFVEAGAGTGKTEALVGRIVSLIASGDVRADQIAAITFTEKAAAELYDRVLERLDQRRDAETDPELERRFAQAAEDLDSAAIETLHAFAARILRMHPIEAGLPPGFTVIDESEASLKFAERWSQALDEMLDDESLGEHLLAAFDAGMQLDDLRAVARSMHADWDRAESASALLPIGDLASQIKEAVGPLRALTEARHSCSNAQDLLAQNLADIEATISEVQSLVESDSSGSTLRHYLSDPGVKIGPGHGGSGKNWDGADRVRAIKDEIKLQAHVPGLIRAIAFAPITASILNRIRKFVIDYADERRLRGELEFQDLLVRASRLLQRDASVAQAVGNRFRRLLIDEFQDNDPLQTQIADAIAGGEPGRLFFVGDPKQSIYRFRRADIRQFNAVKAQREEGLVLLSQNFRSAPGVTEFVNAVFEPLMLEGGSQQAQWEDLQAFRSPPDDSEPSVTVVGEAYQGDVAHARRLEADALARMIADISAKPWQIYDKSIDANRAATFADIAVLVPTRTGLTALLPELEQRGIPYRLESRSLVYNQREVRELLNLLRAIDDPTDQIALVAALKSPAFACADDDLYRWKQAGGRWDYRETLPREIAADDPVADSMHWLMQTSERRWTMSVSELVGYIIRERRLLELAVVERQPREHWQRYRFMIDQARAFNDRGGATLADFLLWAQHQADEDTRVIESVVPEEDHDAVRIMTIHAAKGLEFPIVVFAGLNINRNATTPPLLWHEDGRPEVRVRSGLETPGYAELKELEDELGQHEEVRRNYVGATRARDHLIVSLYRKEAKNGKTSADRIAGVLDGDRASFRRITHDQIPEPPQLEREQEPDDTPVTADDRATWLQRRHNAVAQYASLPRESATGIAKRAAAETEEVRTNPNDEPDDDLPPWRRGRAGTAIGRATHGVLQVIDLQDWTESDLQAASDAQAAAESLNRNQSGEVSRLARVALESDTVREARAANRYWRELYAAVEIEGVLLDGFIDLLYETADGKLVVVDYKTDALREGEAVDAAVWRYRLQAASYALMLEESLNRPVSRCVLLFLHPDEEREVADLRGAIEEVRQSLLTLLITAEGVPVSA